MGKHIWTGYAVVVNAEQDPVVVSNNHYRLPNLFPTRIRGQEFIDRQVEPDNMTVVPIAFVARKE